MLTIIAAAMSISSGQHSESVVPWKEVLGDRLHVWESTLAPLRIEDETLAIVVGFLDPRPPSALRKFSGERLDDCLLSDSRDWFAGIFTNEANPYLHGTRRPTHYGLAPGPGQMSLLLYEWQSENYHFQALESAKAILLRARSRTAKRGVHEAIPGAAVQNMVTSMVRIRLGGAETFGLAPFVFPAHLAPGQLFNNHRGNRVTCLPPSSAEGALGFLAGDSINLLVLKRLGLADRLYPDESDWLPIHLRCEDSDDLVVEKLTGKPYPRP